MRRAGDNNGDIYVSRAIKLLNENKGAEAGKILDECLKNTGMSSSELEALGKFVDETPPREFNKILFELMDSNNSMNDKSRRRFTQNMTFTTLENVNLFLRNGKVGKAERLLNQIIKRHPDSKESYFQRGMLKAGFTREYEKGIRDFTKALELHQKAKFKKDKFDDEKLSQLYDGRGCCYRDLNRFSLALKDARLACKLCPGDTSLYDNLACTYEKLHQYEKALKYFNKSVECGPDNAPSYGNRGLFHEGRGNLQQAYRDYQKALEIDPNFVLIKGYLSCLRIKMGNALKDNEMRKKGKEGIRKIMEMNPQCVKLEEEDGNNQVDYSIDFSVCDRTSFDRKVDETNRKKGHWNIYQFGKKCCCCKKLKKKMMRCSRCKLARYCGSDCQKKHWKVHKKFCKKSKK